MQNTQSYKDVKVNNNTELIMEGIHALNPAFFPDIDPDTSYKIYVSALTSISLDNHNWIPTTDISIDKEYYKGL